MTEAWACGSCRAADQATDDRRLGHRDVATGQQLIDRQLEVLTFGFLPRKSDAVLIVDATVVADGPIPIENENRRIARCAKLAGHLVLDVPQHLKLEVRRPRVSGQFGQRVLHIGIDGDKSHALAGIARRQLRQAGTV